MGRTRDRITGESTRDPTSEQDQSEQEQVYQTAAPATPENLQTGRSSRFTKYPRAPAFHRAPDWRGEQVRKS